MSFLRRLFGTVLGFLAPGNLRRILGTLADNWRSTDVTGKFLIALLFSPSLFVLCWLLFEIAYVVVFTLPGIVIKIVALVFLFGIFWTGAMWVYEKMRGPSSHDDTPTGTGGTSDGTSWKTYSWTWNKK